MEDFHGQMPLFSFPFFRMFADRARQRRRALKTQSAQCDPHVPILPHLLFKSKCIIYQEVGMVGLLATIIDNCAEDFQDESMEMDITMQAPPEQHHDEHLAPTDAGNLTSENYQLMSHIGVNFTTAQMLCPCHEIISEICKSSYMFEDLRRIHGNTWEEPLYVRMFPGNLPALVSPKFGNNGFVFHLYESRQNGIYRQGCRLVQ
jgi:hypothetical protein